MTAFIGDAGRYHRAISFVIGGLIGVAPAVGEAGTVALSALALIHLAITRQILPLAQLKPALGLINYAAAMFCLNAYHLGLGIFQSDSMDFLVQVLVILLLAQLLLCQRLDAGNLVSAAMVAMGAAFLILGADYILHVISRACRAAAFTGNPQWAAAFVVMLLPGLYVAAPKNSPRKAFAMQGLIAMGFVTVGAFTGSRMAFYALVLLAVLGIIWHLAKSQRRMALALALASCTGIAATVVVDLSTGCGFSVRVGQQVLRAPEVLKLFADERSPVKETIEQVLTQTPPAEDTPQVEPRLGDVEVTPPATVYDGAEITKIISAGAERAEMWNNAFETIGDHWLIGIGRDAEYLVATRGFSKLDGLLHVHNQYLSWLVWGGIFGLALGLQMIWSLVLYTPNRRMGVVLAFGLMLILTTESLFYLMFNFNVFIACSLFLARVATDEPSALP